MITPEGSGGGEPQRKTGRAGIIGIAALVVFAGLVLVGVLSSPEPAAVEETTTTVVEDTPTSTVENFSVSQIATGTPFEWGLSMAIDDGYPLGLVDHGGAIYLFATDDLEPYSRTASGIRAWRTIDGASWDLLGRVMPEDRQITGISSTGQGLVALEPDDVGGGFTVWRSDNATDWTPEAVGDDQRGGIPFYPQIAGGSEDVLVVSGNSHTRALALVTGKLKERYPALAPNSYLMTWDIQEETIAIALQTFARLQLGVVDLDDLGLTEDEHAMVDRLVRDESRETTLWVRTDSGWSQDEIAEFDLVQEIATTTGGDILALGFGATGPEAWSTSDGSNWEAIEAAIPAPSQIDEWGDTMAGPTSIPGEGWFVAFSETGDWEAIGPQEHFPTHVTWIIGAFGAGSGGGIAAVVNGWERRREMLEVEPATLTRDGATLTVNFQMSEYVVEVDGSSNTWSMTDENPEGVEADLDTGMVSFHHPDSGEHLASFDIDDINHAFFSQMTPSGRHRALVFTPDGEEWTIQDLAPITVDTHIPFLEISRSHVMAVRVAGENLPFGAPTPGFEVWSAAIP